MDISPEPQQPQQQQQHPAEIQTLVNDYGETFTNFHVALECDRWGTPLYDDLGKTAYEFEKQLDSNPTVFWDSLNRPHKKKLKTIYDTIKRSYPNYQITSMKTTRTKKNKYKKEKFGNIHEREKFEKELKKRLSFYTNPNGSNDKVDSVLNWIDNPPFEN